MTNDETGKQLLLLALEEEGRCISQTSQWFSGFILLSETQQFSHFT